MATPEVIAPLFSSLTQEFTNVEIGVHLHSTADTCVPKIAAAYDAGCRRFDSAVLGYGCCPMAGDDLVGNIPTHRLVEFLGGKNEQLPVSSETIAQLESSFRNLLAS